MVVVVKLLGSVLIIPVNILAVWLRIALSLDFATIKALIIQFNVATTQQIFLKINHLSANTLKA